MSCYDIAMNKPDTENIKHHYAGTFLVTDSGHVVGQRRDDKPTIDNPNKIGTFGGTVEGGEEPKVAAWRELTEETNLKIELDQILYLLDDISWWELTAEWEVRHLYYAKITNSELADLIVYEGQGWAYITNPNEPDLIELWRPATKQLFQTLNLGKRN